jgi:hypothetical protein
VSYKEWQDQNDETSDNSNFELSNTLSSTSGSQLRSQSNILNVEEDKAHESSTREIEIQTMYRESETQTDPYTPEYIINSTSGQKPEIIQLAEMGLSYGTSWTCGDCIGEPIATL